jgi:hypothetical protein
MSTIDLSLLLTGSERNALIGTGPTPLRVVLLAGEVLRMPRARASLRVISGTAWITRGGSDIVLSQGEAKTFGASRESAVISALGALPLLVEVA